MLRVKTDQELVLDPARALDFHRVAMLLHEVQLITGADPILCEVEDIINNISRNFLGLDKSEAEVSDVGWARDIATVLIPACERRGSARRGGSPGCAGIISDHTADGARHGDCHGKSNDENGDDDGRQCDLVYRQHSKTNVLSDAPAAECLYQFGVVEMGCEEWQYSCETIPDCHSEVNEVLGLHIHQG